MASRSERRRYSRRRGAVPGEGPQGQLFGQRINGTLRVLGQVSSDRPGVLETVAGAVTSTALSAVACCAALFGRCEVAGAVAGLAAAVPPHTESNFQVADCFRLLCL